MVFAFDLSKAARRCKKKMLSCTKNYVVSTKKIFHIEIKLPTKIMWVTKKMLWQQKKLYDTKNEARVD